MNAVGMVHDLSKASLLCACQQRWYLGRRDPMARAAPVLHGHHNLPTHATALVGRDREVADLRQLLLSDDGRLITLTGVGGCGKTRLALGVASSLIGSFKDGVWLVELAALADPQLVQQAVTSVLGVRERSDRALLDALVSFLARRQVLLVLDNCEHLVKACAELADTLLHGCPGVRLLATSREALHIPGERAWRVPARPAPIRGRSWIPASSCGSHRRSLRRCRRPPLSRCTSPSCCLPANAARQSEGYVQAWVGLRCHPQFTGPPHPEGSAARTPLKRSLGAKVKFHRLVGWATL
jgi:hypothetical protein